MRLSAIVLAAGFGLRMKSEHPKVLHPILGRPILKYVLDAIDGLSPAKKVVIVGYGADEVKEALGSKDISYALQDKRLGTGHAASCAEGTLKSFNGNILIVNGDFPLITANSLKKFRNAHEKSGSGISVLTATVDDASGYGRIVRDIKGGLERIVEHKDASPEERNINEINSGTYLVSSKLLWSLLKSVKKKNKQGEYYLTDIIEIARKKEISVSAVKLADSNEVLGVNDRAELAQIEALMRERVNVGLMRAGVTLIDPSSTHISPEARIGRDTEIYPGTHIYGASRIGSGTFIGPNVWIEDSVIGKNVHIRSSCYITEARIGDSVTVGPFAHLRPEADISQGAKIGNFVEIKKSKVGRGSKVPHLSYVGDASLGKGVNIGAGTITCNYDGVNKYRTELADDVFIGSDTMLVAPVKLGKGAVTGAGSTITKDVPAGALAIGRARQTVIENWQNKSTEKKKTTTKSKRGKK